MHTYINYFDAPKFEPILKEGSIYSINRFQLRKAKFSYNAVLGEYNIHLTKATQIEEQHDDMSEYPRHYFNLIPFNKLHDRIDQNTYLTGSLRNSFFF